MAITGDSVTLDESSGLQNTGIPTATEDNDGNANFSTLQSVFAGRLFDPATSGGLAPDSTFSQNNGVAVANLISLSGQTTITGFLDGGDNPLLAYESGITDPTTGVENSFATLDGEKIYLFVDQDKGLGDSMALGVDANGDIAFAAFLDADASDADVWLFQIESISNPDATDPDDPVDLTGLLNVDATTPLIFNLNTLPSGQNLSGDPTVTMAGLDAGYKVGWETDGDHNQALIEGVAGKFDIGLFGITEPTPTPDKELAFTVAITDFDGDVEEDTFVIGFERTQLSAGRGVRTSAGGSPEVKALESDALRRGRRLICVNYSFQQRHLLHC